jgi:hypothetical protein
VEVHVRSAFLQGLLLMAPDSSASVLRDLVCVEHLRYAGGRCAIPNVRCRRWRPAWPSCNGSPASTASWWASTTAAQLLDEIVAAAAAAVRWSYPWEELGLTDSGRPRPFAMAGEVMSEQPVPAVCAFLQARVSSTRLPGKVLKPLLGEAMLLRQIERLRHSALASTRLVVVTSTDASPTMTLAAVCTAHGMRGVPGGAG